MYVGIVSKCVFSFSRLWVLRGEGGSEANCAIAYLDSRYVSYGICICLFAYVVCVLCAGTEAGLTRTLLAA